jgi:hypothetical protein
LLRMAQAAQRADQHRSEKRPRYSARVDPR